MKLNEKRDACRDFVASGKFTKATYGVLIVFRDNVTAITHLVTSHEILLRRIESGDVRHNFTDEQLDKIKSLIFLDMLAKVMTLIENLFVLLDCFARDANKDIPRILVRYAFRRIDGFIKRFEASRVSLWRIAGFPGIRFLARNCGLNGEESSFLHALLTDSCESIRLAIHDIVTFYQANRILYTKFKHGLLFLPGLRFSGGIAQAPSSILLSFDRLARKPSRLCFEGRDISPEGLEWFNTYSIQPCWSETLRRYGEILTEIGRLSRYVIGNHLLWAFNCGEDYLPVKISSNGENVVEIYLTKQLTPEEEEKFNRIWKKVETNMYAPNMKLNVVFNFSPEKNQKILRCFAENQCATIWKAGT